MRSVADKYPDHFVDLIKRDIGYPSVAWTPPEALVIKVVHHFLATEEPGWLDAAVRRDPALYRHLDLSTEDLATFRKGGSTLKELVEKDKISPEILHEITNEVKTYQGLHAIAFHRLAHSLYERAWQEKDAGDRAAAAKDLLLARQISQGVRRLTAGIEIHPGATIGKNFFIDHGAGVVIGETCKIGDNVFLYHGVTLGAHGNREVDEGSRIPRRHPVIGDNTIISTGVNILGPITIGKNVRISSTARLEGAVTVNDNAVIQNGVLVTKDVPMGANVVGSLPNLPGLIDYNKDPQKSAAGTLILQPSSQEKPKTTLAPEPQWRIYINKLFQQVAQRA